MTKKIMIILLILSGCSSISLGIYRMSFPYDELGNYFDGIVNYHEQSIVVYIFLGIVFLTLGMILSVYKRR